MKVKHYDQMMAWLTRPGFKNGGSASELNLLKKKLANIVPKSSAAIEEYLGVIKEYYDAFKKINKRAPTQLELRESGAGQSGIRSAQKKYGFDYGRNLEKEAAGRLKKTEIMHAKEVVEPTTQTIKGVKSKVRFPPGMEKEFMAEIDKRYKYPMNSLEAKKAGVLSDTELHKRFFKKGTPDKLTDVLTLIIKDKKLKYPKQTYEGEKKTEQILKQRKVKAVKDVSSLSKEQKIRDLKRGEKGIDLAHRSSLYETRRVGDKYKISSLGIDPSEVNQLLVKPSERELEKIYRQRAQLIKGIKPNQVPKEIQKQLEIINKNISDISAKTNGRIQGIMIDEKTLKPSRFGKSAITEVGMGLVEDKPVSKLTKADLDLIKLNMPAQIKAQRSISPGQLNAKIPGLTRLIEEVAAIPEEFKAKKYWRVGLKGLGLAFTPLMAYDGYQAAKEGRPVAEVIERALIGTEGVYKAKEYFNMSPEAKAASSRINMQKMAEAGMQDPRVRGGGEFEADFIQEGDQDLILSEQDKYKMRRQQEDALRAQQRAAAIKMVHQRITGQPVYSMEFAGGGIANVRRPWAVPPASGPMPQGGGLSSVFNRVKPW